LPVPGGPAKRSECSPCSGDFKATLGLCLATHVSKIRIVDARIECHIVDETFGQHRLPGQVRANLEQGIGGEHLHLVGQGCLAGTAGREHEAAPHAAGSQDHRQRPADRPQFAGERQFAGEFMTGQRGGRDLARSSEDAEGNRQIEAA
jgi:hypothetical protein